MYKHHRRTIRLKNYDYSQDGAYFVTICTNKHEIIFSDVNDGKLILNEFGIIVDNYWKEIPKHFPNVVLDEYIVMPDHIHGIIIINGNENVVRAQNFEPLQKPIQSPKNEYQKIIPGSIGSIIRGFKIGVTKWFRNHTDIYTIWQRNYWERIIPSEKELNHIRKYIIDNPLKWDLENTFHQNMNSFD